jgi:hypothetical protein
MTQTKNIVALLVSSAALASMLMSCGGGSGVASCGKVAACGGDVVGNYTIAGACFNNAALNMQIVADCPGASVNVSGVSASGSASFNADLTYTLTETMTVTATETIPPSCLTQGALTLTCAQVDQLLQQEVATDPTTFQSAHCSGSSTCTCTFKTAAQTNTETGTYTISGTTLITTSSAGSVSSSAYCVKDNALHVMEVDMTMPMGTAQADIVLTKK